MSCFFLPPCQKAGLLAKHVQKHIVQEHVQTSLIFIAIDCLIFIEMEGKYSRHPPSFSWS